jgi:predicted MPP superfamily phosphohydrolase
MNRRSFIKSITAVGIGAFLGGSAYAYHSTCIEISRQIYTVPGLAEKLRIVAISDLHLPCWYSPTEELIRIINLESPDALVIIGDTVDKGRDEHLVQMFEKIQTRLGKYAVLGNWEYSGGASVPKLFEEYQKAGCILLVNEPFRLSELNAFGLDDLVFGHADYESVRRLAVRGQTILIISHCPACFDAICSISKGRVLVIAGHTHGGQIAPFGVAISTPEGSGPYIKGWYHKGMHSMYVMRGIGTTPGLPIRIGVRPEVLVLEITGSETI